MKRLPRLPLWIPIVTAAAAGLALASCGDGGATCGPGTMEVDGTCVPDVTCGEGTHAEGGVCVADSQCGAGTQEDPTTGECVPDGSVICPQGTTFEDGQCQIDPSACAEGTVLIDGHCVLEDDALMADHDEAAEPNDLADTPAGTIALGAVDASTVIHGCVTPRADDDGDGNLDADFDLWIVNATAPSTIEITADGVHGLVAGFVMLNGDPALAQSLANWRRFGINLTGDTAKREVYLPAAGSYALLMTDARSLVLGTAGAGGPDACYYTTIKRIATPAPVALTVPQTATTDDGKVKLYSFSAPTTGRILDITLNTDSAVMSPAFLVLRGAQNALYASTRLEGTTAPSWTVGGLDMGETVTLVSDMEYNWGLDPQDYAYDLVDINAGQLPADGTVTLTKRNGQTPFAVFADYNYLYFDVAGSGTIVNFNITADNGATPAVNVPVDLAITRRDLFNPGDVFVLIEPFGDPGRASGFANQFVRFDRPGRYYLVLQDPRGTSGETYRITSRFATVATSAVTLGTPLANQALPASGNGFHTLDLTNPVWLQFGATGTSFPAGTATARISLYDLAGNGWLGGNYPAAHAVAVNADGSNPFGRILANDTRDWLVRVEAVGTPGANPTYTLDIRNRDAANLGMLTPGTPINRNGMDLVPAAVGTNYGVRRFIVFGTSPANTLAAMVTPTSATADIDIRRVDASEASVGAVVNAGAAGAAEALAGSFLFVPTDWIAFEVRNRDVAAPTNLNLSLSSVAAPYQTTLANNTWSDACTGPGTEILGSNLDDEFIARRALPAGWTFRLLGTQVSHYIIGANGFLVMGDGTVANPTCTFGCYINATIPSTAVPNNLVAPFWNDYDTVRICARNENDKVTIQWTGFEWGATPSVAFQAVLHMNGVIDFIYNSGSAHTSTGGSATVGLENATGMAGLLLGYNTALPLAGKRVTMTPMP